MPIWDVDKYQRSWLASVIRSGYFANLRRTTSKNSNNAKKSGGMPPTGALTTVIKSANTAYLLLEFRLAVERE
jgi:hypothetical protein